MTKKLSGYSLEDYGVDSASYFQGASTAYTGWDAAYVGIGESAREAGEDALESAASNYDVSMVVNNLSTAEEAHLDCETCDGCEAGDCEEHGLDDPHAECEMQHYAVLFVKEQD